MNEQEYRKKIRSIIEKATGKGMGQGNQRQGTGGTDKCYCPECGYKTDHKRGVPCNEKTCPECGNAMTGVSPEDGEGSELNEGGRKQPGWDSLCKFASEEEGKANVVLNIESGFLMMETRLGEVELKPEGRWILHTKK